MYTISLKVHFWWQVPEQTGGPAYTNIVDSMFFDGVASAALVEAAAIGSMLISPMIKQDDDREFTTAVTPLSSLERGRE